MTQPEKSGPAIKVLPDRVAKIIAAGEVIDRPFSVVRELLDNSLDALATEITVSTGRGGTETIRVSDNGAGMCEEDLLLSYLPHATSKIACEDDMTGIRTLGFRGEALSSIATCSRLEITSKLALDSHGHRLSVAGGKLISIEDFPAAKGTAVTVSDLFFNMPARKKFLKAAGAEQTMCRNILIDKALPEGEVSFRLFSDEELKLFLPKSDGLGRVYAAYGGYVPAGTLFEEHGSGEGFSIRAVLGRPEVSRKDRRLIQIFVNRRRIYDYSLQQAVDYGFSGYIPGKDNPVAFIFVEIEPELVDFNIHPAKKECRIRFMPALHSELSRVVRRFASRFSISFQLADTGAAVLKETPGESEDYRAPVLSAYSAHAENRDFTVRQAEDDYGKPSDILFEGKQIRYIGQAMNLFLLAECEGTLYIIDQHAAHEKIIFEKLAAEKRGVCELLFPFAFEATPDQASGLSKSANAYAGLGIRIESTGSCDFEITALPEYLVSCDYDEIVAVLATGEGDLGRISNSLLSMAACRSAVKEGDVLDSLTAVSLVREAFALGNARCPHGRPVWFAITRDELYNFLRRK